MKTDVYDVITDRICRQLESGTVPWRKPWHTVGMPKNLISKKDYRGINVFLLSCAPYDSPYWLTYKQAKKLGATVRKGEKATPVVFWKWFEPKNRPEPPEGFTSTKEKQIPMLRYYSVFNVRQVDGLDDTLPLFGPEFEPLTHNTIDGCENVVKSMPNAPEIELKGNRACYSPTFDTVAIPPLDQFKTAEEYYSTEFHELVHSTGHKSRLNRKTLTDSAGFGSNVYSQEELVAEFGAAFLCGHCQIENITLDNSASYIAGWLKKLRSNKKYVVLAAAQAQKAADYILNRKFDS